MLSGLRACAEQVRQPPWGLGGPHDAGTYRALPHQTGFFAHNGNWTSPYGRFFLQVRLGRAHAPPLLLLLLGGGRERCRAEGCEGCGARSGAAVAARTAAAPGVCLLSRLHTPHSRPLGARRHVSPRAVVLPVMSLRRESAADPRHPHLRVAVPCHTLRQTAQWYSEMLVRHAARLLGAASEVRRPTRPPPPSAGAELFVVSPLARRQRVQLG